MSKRERSIAMAVGGVMGIWLLDAVLITPLFNDRDDLQAKVVSARKDFDDAKRLIRSQALLNKDLDQAKASGLMQDQANAQNQMVDRLDAWARATGVEITSLSPSASSSAINKIGKSNEKEKAFLKLTCRASVKGSLQQIGQFIYQIQISDVPLRVNDFTVEPEKEGLDGLKVTMEVSTIFLATDTNAPATAAPAAGRGNASPASTRPGANTMAQTGTTRPTTNATPILPSANLISVEEQMRQRRMQQTQSSAAAAPATAPTTRTETAQ